MKRKKQHIQIILTVLLSLCITACGKQADLDQKAGTEDRQEAGTEWGNGIQGDATEWGNGIQGDATKSGSGIQGDATESGNGMQEDSAGLGNRMREDATKSASGIQEDEKAEWPEPDNIITTYLTEDMEYSDEIMPVQFVDDLRLIGELKYADKTYVYQGGKVYFRRYHKDSYEETALWGMYDFIPGTKTEIVCIDSDGRETELFADEGYGDIYLINGRFYMTDGNITEEKVIFYENSQLYSVDMQGNNRIDYGNGKILMVDRERNIFILQMREQDEICYYVLNCETGEKKLIPLNSDDYYIYIEGYRDGWIYYEKRKKDDSTVSGLCAVSLEGEQREIITLTSDINKGFHTYTEGILHLEADEDRIYFVFGGYDGSAQMFQGGKLISIKHDGTDYKAVDIQEEDYYLCHENGRALVYFVNSSLRIEDSRKEYNALVWDVDVDICYLSELTQNILYAYNSRTRGMWSYYPGDKGALCELTLYNDVMEEETNIYAIPDDSGKIVRVAMNLGDSITMGNEEQKPFRYKDLYYADGYLYFTAEYSIYDEGASLGWRDGYRRLRSEIYRLKTGESTAQMLYSY